MQRAFYKLNKEKEREMKGGGKTPNREGPTLKSEHL